MLIENPKNNRLPEKIEYIHLMGICGTGMGSLAGMLKEQGFHLSGSDQAVYPPMSTFLSTLGIPVMEGYHSAHLTPLPDLVIVGNVIARSNPEAQEMIRLGLPYLSLPQALAHFFLKDHCSLVVAGTHGKTTTSALLASILDQAGLSPGFMIGGILKGYERNFQVGSGKYFVIEGDEYDTAFFDKGPKLLHYRPFYAVLTSLEFDHADIYPDIETIQDAFSRFLALVPKEGLLAAYGPEPRIAEILSEASCPVENYGLEESWDWCLRDLKTDLSGSTFSVFHRGVFFHSFRTPLAGRHNALNCLSLMPILNHLGLSPEQMARGLAAFQGIHRRQEVRGIKAGVTIMDDFAHHPTAVRETIRAIRSQYQSRRLLAVFEPRTNTSRRRVFQNDYARSFEGADLVIVREPPDLLKIPEKERFSSLQLAENLKDQGLKAFYFSDTEAILDFLWGELRSGDVVLIMSNGGFDHIHERLLSGLEKLETMKSDGQKLIDQG